MGNVARPIWTAYDTALQAPMDGAVRQRHARVGEYLEEGAPVGTVRR
jgi:multidrug resistance efflux pump